MTQSTDWHPTDDDLAALAREVEDAFHVERALFSADLRHRVLNALPQRVTAAVRAARMLSALILIGSLGVLVLAVEFLAAQTGAWNPLALMRVVCGLGAAILAVLLAFAGPGLLAWEGELRSRLGGRPVRPGAADLVFARVTALLMLVMGGWILI